MNKRVFYILVGLFILLITLYFSFRSDNNSNNNIQKEEQDVQENFDNSNNENIVDIIEHAKRANAIQSTYSYISDVEFQMVVNKLDGNDFDSGKYYVSQMNDILKLSSRDIPDEGNVCVNNLVVTKGIFKFDSYVISYDGKDAKIIDSNEVEDISCLD